MEGKRHNTLERAARNAQAKSSEGQKSDGGGSSSGNGSGDALSFHDVQYLKPVVAGDPLLMYTFCDDEEEDEEEEEEGAQFKMDEEKSK